MPCKLDPILNYTRFPPYLFEYGLAWVRSDPLHSGHLYVGLVVGGSVVPSEIYIDPFKCTSNHSSMLDEVDRAIDSAKAILVGSFC